VFDADIRKWSLKLLRPILPFCTYLGDKLENVEVKVRANVVGQDRNEDEDMASEESEEDGQPSSKKRKTTHGLLEDGRSWMDPTRASKVFSKIINAARFAFREECVFSVFDRVAYGKVRPPQKYIQAQQVEGEEEEEELLKEVKEVYTCDCNELNAKEMIVSVARNWSVTMTGVSLIPGLRWKSYHDEHSKIEFSPEKSEWKFSYKRVHIKSVDSFLENDYKPFLRIFNIAKQFDAYRELAPDVKIIYLSPKTIRFSFPSPIRNSTPTNKNHYTNGHNKNKNNNTYNNLNNNYNYNNNNYNNNFSNNNSNGNNDNNDNGEEERLIMSISSLSIAFVITWHFTSNNIFSSCKEMESLASVMSAELLEGADISYLMNSVKYSIPPLYALHRWLVRSLLLFQSETSLKQYFSSTSTPPLLPSHLLPDENIYNNNDNTNNNNNNNHSNDIDDDKKKSIYGDFTEYRERFSAE